MEMQMHREIPAPAADVWRVLGEGYGDLEWSSDITRSYLEGELGVGAVRVCEFPPNVFSSAGAIREQLIGFDRGAMTMAYQTEVLPGIMRQGTNRWTIVALGPDRCRIESRATIDLRGPAVLLAPLMKLMLRRIASRFVAELTQQVQTVQRAA